MEAVQYTISEASQQLKIEAHVLRYWEEELELEIPRNEWGHRYYTTDELTIFEQIKVLKDKGLQLRAIKAALADPESIHEVSITLPLTEYQTQMAVSDMNIGDPNNEKVRQFLEVLKQTFQYALEEHQESWKEILKEEFAVELRKEISNELEEVLKRQEKLEKERFQKVDQTLREVQKMRQELGTYQHKRNKKPKNNKWLQKFMIHQS